MKRSGPIQRKTPLRPVSKKRQKLNRQRAQMVKTELQQRPQCEAGPRITEFLTSYYSAEAAFWFDRKTPCYVQSTELHEPLTRARGGSIVDPANTVAICRRCHDWIHAHPDDAEQCGLLESAFGVRRQDEN